MRIYGTEDSETLTGTSGRDEIRGYGGDDDLFGGAGNDNFYFTRGSGHDTIHDWNVGDTIDIRGGDYQAVQVGEDVHITFRGGEVDVIGVHLSDLHFEP